REFALASVKLTAQWWFDFMGGYFSDDILMSEIKKMITIKEGYKKIKMASASRIAVFADTESLYYVSEESTAGLDCVKNVYENLKLIGAPHDIFLFSDIDSPSLNIDQYRLIVFLNSFVITEAKRQYINEKIKKDGRSILWIYAPGYILEDGFSEKNVSDMVNINVECLEEPENEIVMLPDGPGFDKAEGLSYGFTNKATGVQIFRGVEHPVSPVFYIDDKDAVAIGKYRKSGKTALGFRQFKEFTSYYSAAGNLPVGVLREIARKAGATIYYEGTEPVYVNNRLIGIHNAPGGTITFNVPSGIRFKELFDGGMYESNKDTLQVDIQKGSTKLYLADREIEA
ncbi:MAG: hypothetical protein PHG48_06570, partial [Eubacteriales bacterium]|nr:hypothetical protein [Eubacteriales bacterium]